MARSFLDASIVKLVSQLKVEEKINLLSGPNWWNTTAIPRLGIPSVRMSDGPNVRPSSSNVCSNKKKPPKLGGTRVKPFRANTCAVSACMYGILTNSIKLTVFPVCYVACFYLWLGPYSPSWYLFGQRGEAKIFSHFARAYLQYSTHPSRRQGIWIFLWRPTSFWSV